MVCLRRALALRPDHKAAQVNLGLGLMAEGDWANAWRAYESRWAGGQYGIGPERFAKPLWDGKPLDGKKLFVWWEQGFGDTIQYLRFVEPALARAPHLVLSVQDALFDLARSLPWKALLTPQPLPEERFDLHAPLMSLPAILGLTAEAIAVAKPYLHARRDRVAYWRTKLADLPQPRIALVWQGSTDNPEDRRRSMRLADLAPLFDLAASFVSLQKGPPAKAIATEGLSGRILDLDASLTDFAETSAILQSVDLLISVDSAVAHLAGAMGRPVWLALSDVPGPRWGLVEAHTPWYRQTSLFRQTKGGDWSGPVGQMRARLTERLAGMKVPGVSEPA
jgi:Glycosyltransferase family 9 (heptosyltransferase)